MLKNFELEHTPEPFLSPIRSLIGSAQKLQKARRSVWSSMPGTGVYDCFEKLLKTPLDNYQVDNSIESLYVPFKALAITVLEHPFIIY